MGTGTAVEVVVGPAQHRAVGMAEVIRGRTGQVAMIQDESAGTLKTFSKLSLVRVSEISKTVFKNT